MRPTEEEIGVRETERAKLDALEAERELLNLDLLTHWSDRDGDQISKIAEYALLPAGKLLRPLLLLESARCVGGRPAELTKLALAVEYLHTATLVHDDIIDADDMRRGRPSVQAAFGVPTAILVGDALIFETFAALTGPRPDRVSDAAVAAAVAILATAGLNLCRGQLLESELAGDLTCTVDQYLTMVRWKTGELFESPCRIGVLLGGGRPEWADSLGLFGRHLGTAFQIRDDLLAFDSTSAQTGKPTGSDLQNRRPTLPLLMAYRLAGPGDRRELERAFRAPSIGDEAEATVRGIVETTGARDATARYAADYVDQAKQCLASLPSGESTLVLGAIADYAYGRRS
jgi:geranylgeranyl diphosphate synthase, type I